MRNALRVASSLALSASLCGCGSQPGGAGDMAGGSGLQVGIGPLALMPGEEKTYCSTVRLGNAEAVDVVTLQSELAPGSHHLVLYQSSATSEARTPTPCQPFEGITTGETPLFIAETQTTTLTLPSGVAYHFAAGQMVKLEAHYINATTGAINGMGTVSLTAGSGGAYQQAGFMFCGSMRQLDQTGIPPDTQRYTLDPGFYGGGGDVDFTKLKVFAFTSHEHHLGSEVTIAKSTAASSPGTLLYDNTSWDHPPLQLYDDAHLLTFGAGEGFRWQCSYDSLDATPKPTTTTYYGLSAVSNEMCFIWAYYYPSVGRFVGPNDCID
jgi:hypothetical protein